MKKYRVITNELRCFVCTYEVEAESEDDIYNMDYEDLQAWPVNEEPSFTDEYNIASIEEIER